MYRSLILLYVLALTFCFGLQKDNRLLQILLDELKRLDLEELNLVIEQATNRRNELIGGDPLCSEGQCSVPLLSQKFKAPAFDELASGSDDLFPVILKYEQTDPIIGAIAISLRLPGRQSKLPNNARFLNLAVVASKESLLFFNSSTNALSPFYLYRTGSPLSCITSGQSLKEAWLLAGTAAGSLHFYLVSAWIEQNNGLPEPKLKLTAEVSLEQNSENPRVEQLAISKRKNVLFFVGYKGGMIRVYERSGELRDEVLLGGTGNQTIKALITGEFQRTTIATENGFGFLRIPQRRSNQTSDLVEEWCDHQNITQGGSYIYSLAHDPLHTGILWAGTSEGRLLSFMTRNTKAMCQVRVNLVIEKGAPLQVCPIRGYIFVSSPTTIYVYNTTEDNHLSPIFVSQRQITSTSNPSFNPLFLSAMATSLGEEYVVVATNSTNSGDDKQLSTLYLHQSHFPYSPNRNKSWLPTRLPVMLVALALVGLYQWWKRKGGGGFLGFGRNRRESFDYQDGMPNPGDPAFAHRIHNLSKTMQNDVINDRKRKEMYKKGRKGAPSETMPFGAFKKAVWGKSPSSGQSSSKGTKLTSGNRITAFDD